MKKPLHTLNGKKVTLKDVERGTHIPAGTLSWRMTHWKVTLQQAVDHGASRSSKDRVCLFCGKPKSEWTFFSYPPCCCWACLKAHRARNGEEVEERSCACNCGEKFTVPKTSSRKYYSGKCRLKSRAEFVAGDWPDFLLGERREDFESFCTRNEAQCAMYPDCLGSREDMDCYVIPERGNVTYIRAINVEGRV